MDSSVYVLSNIFFPLHPLTRFSLSLSLSLSLSAQSGHEDTCSSLLVHLFGQKQDAVLQFPAFFIFMENLQNEVLELEFLEFSQGMVIISELDFAEILLRTSAVSTHDAEVYKDRLRERVTDSKVGFMTRDGCLLFHVVIS